MFHNNYYLPRISYTLCHTDKLSQQSIIKVNGNFYVDFQNLPNKPPTVTSRTLSKYLFLSS